jgi:site-specific recombinase XerD
MAAILIAQAVRCVGIVAVLAESSSGRDRCRAEEVEMSKVPRCRVLGPLAEYVEGFRAELDRLGYTAMSREYKVNQVGRLSRWMAAQQLGVGDLNTARLAGFFATMATSRRRPPTVAAMRPLLDFLRAQGALASGPERATPREQVDELMDDYCQWMTADRALADRTIDRYETTARRFLAGRVAAAGFGTGAEGVTAGAVTAFLLTEVSRGLARGSLQGRVAELRSLLRFLYLKGFTDTEVARAVPPLPGWKDTAVPPRLATAQVQALLDSCDRATTTGMRDYAMLALLARLGLRAAEVAALSLDDMRWRAGEVVVRGKGRREDRLPLPADVGDSVTRYLREARPRAASRNLFLTVRAPHRPLWSTSVSQVVWRQSLRAGLAPMRAHRLRHALATDLLDRGVRLPEIAQVLRQRDLATTAVYAKVDHTTLRQLALPWPVTR